MVRVDIALALRLALTYYMDSVFVAGLPLNLDDLFIGKDHSGAGNNTRYKPLDMELHTVHC